jgi:glycosyltransferase involved in cell wall biosynthesis
MRDTWVVLAEGTRRRWGGDLRRHYLLRGLAERTSATVLEDWRAQRLARTLRPIVGRRWKIWRRRALVAAVEVLDDEQLEPIERYGRPFLLDIHDDPLLQGAALGIEPSAAAAAAITERSARNQARFRWLLAPSRPFAVLAGLPLERLIVAPNGTATDVVRPAPWPATPAVAFVSGAAPRRGIEELIAAARIVRGSLVDVRLDLWLAATGDDSRTYLDGLMAAVAAEPWIRIGQTPYEELGSSVGRASVLAIPTPAHPYWDSVAPIKLFDNLAAGRPIVTTPRTETARVVVEANAGIVTADDSPEAIATALLRLLTDDAVARRMGANARAVAEREYDWAVIGRRLADDVLATTRLSRLLGSPRAIR